MPSFLNLHAIAAARGEGLRPEFQALFERLAAATDGRVTNRPDGMVQAGPDPAAPELTAAESLPDERPAKTCVVRSHRRTAE